MVEHEEANRNDIPNKRRYRVNVDKIVNLTWVTRICPSCLDELLDADCFAVTIADDPHEEDIAELNQLPLQEFDKLELPYAEG